MTYLWWWLFVCIVYTPDWTFKRWNGCGTRHGEKKSSQTLLKEKNQNKTKKTHTHQSTYVFEMPKQNGKMNLKLFFSLVKKEKKRKTFHRQQNALFKLRNAYTFTPQIDMYICDNRDTDRQWHQETGTFRQVMSSISWYDVEWFV